MNLIRIGNRTVNMDNVTVVLDEDDRIGLIFQASWPLPDGNVARSCEWFSGDEARQIRRWIERNAFDLMRPRV